MTKIQKTQLIKHIWSVLCTSTSVDKNSNSLSMFNIVEEITLHPPKGPEQKAELKKLEQAKLPITVGFSLELVSLWKREDKNKDREDLIVDIEIDLLDPIGNSLHRYTAQAVFKKGLKRLRFINKLNAIKVNGLGEHNFKISIKEPKDNSFREVVQIPFDVKVDIGIK